MFQLVALPARRQEHPESHAGSFALRSAVAALFLPLGAVAVTAAALYSESDSASLLQPDPSCAGQSLCPLIPLRVPQKVWGVEGTFAWPVAPTLAEGRLIVAFSGFYLNLPKLVEEPMLAAGLELGDPRQALGPSAAFAGGADVGWRRAVEAATAAVPGARPFGLTLDEERGYYQVRLIEHDDVLVRGTRRVMIDAGNGDVVVDWSQLGTTAAEKFVGWQFPLHSGQAFGEFGRWLASLLSLVTCGLVIAGVAVFLLRRARRQRARCMTTFVP
jgi:uncharacterized iron-regulated membrane protein